jgi:hypothetical protein
MNYIYYDVKKGERIEKRIIIIIKNNRSTLKLQL